MSDANPLGAVDISDPDKAMELGAEFAGDILKVISSTILAAPMHARVAFFEAHLATLIGGMKAVLGEELAAEAFDEIRSMCFAGRKERRPSLH